MKHKLTTLHILISINEMYKNCRIQEIIVYKNKLDYVRKTTVYLTIPTQYKI